jgi:hypothetical protein
MFSNELSHGPGFERRANRSQFVREVAKQHTDEFALAVPETGEQLPFFFGREQVEEKVVTLVSATFAVCPDRLRLAVFMAAFLGETHRV